MPHWELELPWNSRVDLASQPPTTTRRQAEAEARTERRKPRGDASAGRAVEARTLARCACVRWNSQRQRPHLSEVRKLARPVQRRPIVYAIMLSTSEFCSADVACCGL
jgi:hypothetical protein